jgi:hypothetical protein
MVGKGKKIVRISLASMEKVVKDVINNKISIPMQVKNIIYQNQHCIDAVLFNVNNSGVVNTWKQSSSKKLILIERHVTSTIIT